MNESRGLEIYAKQHDASKLIIIINFNHKYFKAARTDN